MLTDTPSLQDTAVATVLLVDDEPNILRALRRVLRQEPYRVLTADDGEQALAVMRESAVDLVVSDSRMPGMDGAELLSRIQQEWPDCRRLMLTGHADMTSTIRAINEGQLYRYIAKPWSDDELRQILRQALAHHQAEREQRRLEALTRAQNRELAALNESLEQRVAARTTELREVADMLDLAYGELKRSYVTATQVFSSLINQRLPRNLQTNAQVSDLVKAFAETHDLDEELKRSLLMAAALYNLGKMTWDDRILNAPSERLFAADRETYKRYPVTGEGLLMALDYLEDTAKIIRHHRERWNGSGYPDHLKDEQIPYGARLLGLAVDFIELQRGMILQRRLPRDDALKLLKKLGGRVYDPQLCEAFVTLCIEQAPDLGLAGQSVMSLDTRRLEPGMILVRDLHSESGMLLLNEGKQLTRGLIDRLMRFEETEDTSYTLWVKLPDGDPE
ncbi:HD domain-containing phosphohydrolase [Halomonas kalidii]|uniref:Response regulator n=1 Tax=Halomonas kalidii TaxID=3043293 RepID=A0ABT6VPJ1_9GAMM|nr:HD domain-containing phosphohydrolase [Halomonas kalidii]MDI5935162.1 response regulator [Halomonas kalidii]